MKRILAVLFIILITSPLFAEHGNFSIYTNGFRWLDYSNKEKHIYAGYLYTKFNIDSNKYPAKKIIATLDHLYELALQKNRGDELDKFLVLPCTVVLSGFIDALKEEAEKFRKK